MASRILCAAVGVAMVAGTGVAGEPDGKELFERVWKANDERSHGGDGLGPVFNANSCIACHDQGGAGGGGALDKNVHLLTATLPPLPVREHFQATVIQLEQPAGSSQAPTPETLPDPSDVPLAGNVPAAPQPVVITEEQARRNFEEALDAGKKHRASIRKKLVATLHPEFAESDTVVVHVKGVDEKAHETWRQSITSRQLVQQLHTIDSFSVVPPNGPGVHQLGFNPVNMNGQISFGAVDPNAFPILSEMTARVNQLKGQANPMSTVATPFEGGASLRQSQRNTTALWGSGVIDRIPAEAIEALAKRQAEEGGRVSGRPHRLADGSLGRFGWKAQEASLRGFTIAACANELGLEVPGAHQATVAYKPKYEAKGLDLDEAELDALVDYIANLPSPTKKPTTAKVDDKDTKNDTSIDLTNGYEVFASVGCAKCHVEDVGPAKGVFTDLLLHDMGADLGAVGSYGVPQTPEPDPQDVPIASAEGEAKPKAVPPTSREWRTPPLWGVGSTAPYLHDGRAKTLEQAIAFHGGEAAESRLRFLLLSDEEKANLIGFLDSLVAPEVASRK